MPLRAAVLLAVAIASGAAAVAAGPVVVPSSDLPPSVVALGPLNQASGFDLSADRTVAVAALPSSRNPGRSILRISRGDALREIELAGAVRALALADDGGTAYAIAVESDKKGVVRRTTLLRVDVAAAKVALTITLPASAFGIAPAAGGRALLVASRDEIRTFLLPALTSGPLYRVAGESVAVAPVAGTTRAVVAQGASVALVDLASPQDRDGLKILDRVETGAGIRQLVASPDDAAALAVTESGEGLDVAFDPLRVTPRGEVVAAAWPGTAAAPPAPPTAAVAPPESPPVPEKRPAPVEAPAAAAAGAAVGAAAADSVDEAKPPEPAPPSATPPSADTVEAPPAEPPPSIPGTVRGVLTGPDRSEVETMVALGPDNVLKEAARVAPDAVGRFVFTGLTPGAYRIVAAGKGGRVLVCDPPYVTIRLGPGGSAEAPALSVQKGY